MSEVILIASGKGGVGKTTTVANLGTSLAMQGKKVCLVDLDIRLGKLGLIIGLEGNVVFNIMDLINKDCNLDEALLQDKKTNNLFLLPASRNRQDPDLNFKRFGEILEELRNKEFDYVLIDCPAGIGENHPFMAAIDYADKAIIVVNSEVSSLWDADTVISMLEEKGYNSNEDISLLITKYMPEMSKKKDAVTSDNICEMLAVPLLGIIPDDRKIIVSTNKGIPVVYQNRTKSSSEYKAVAERIINGVVINNSSNGKIGFFGKLFGAVAAK